MNPIAQDIGALGGIGIEAYQIASGAPVSTTSVGGVTTVQTGAAVSQTTGLIVLGVLALLVVGLLVFFK